MKSHQKYLAVLASCGMIFSMTSCKQVSTSVSSESTSSAEEVSDVQDAQENPDTAAAEVKTSEPVKVELGKLMGYDNCYCIREATEGMLYCWTFYNGKGEEIAYQVGFTCVDEPKYYLKDLDDDGIDEMICSGLYNAADDGENLRIFRNNNGTVEVGICDDDRIRDRIGDYGEAGLQKNGCTQYYDVEKDKMIFYDASKSWGYEMTIDDFEFSAYDDVWYNSVV